MQVEAIYNQGNIQLLQPLHLKRNNFRLVVNVPDEEIAAAPLPVYQSETQVNQQPAMLSFADTVEQILAPYRQILNAPPATEPMDYQAIWEEHLLQKYLASHEKPDL
ncbi:MAG: hypothetical protein U1D25_13070 [Hydrogenophaga sp.]|uniref:hypothetical protein n=1 Tax=Hydrogenophaga sp. TaxID=1904254 RepID=UPI0027736DF4|nr:hypothetical protein [Hydrogenophaga sp.]MDP2416295.1 hypothetical protein [Hydrogenophaga sp.]MDZ4189022.1 hypothetical protein [Hydrogenophaga sp.]